jgi:hypothetical protein
MLQWNFANLNISDMTFFAPFFSFHKKYFRSDHFKPWR